MQAAHVSLHPQAYSTLIEVARARMPAETLGALLGSVQYPNGQKWIIIKEAIPVRLITAGSGLAADLRDWANLIDDLSADDGDEDALHIVGWFYADPAMGVFQPRLDVDETQQAFLPDAQSFLIVNPSVNQGALYTWEEDSLVLQGNTIGGVLMIPTPTPAPPAPPPPTPVITPSSTPTEAPDDLHVSDISAEIPVFEELETEITTVASFDELLYDEYGEVYEEETVEAVELVTLVEVIEGSQEQLLEQALEQLEVVEPDNEFIISSEPDFIGERVSLHELLAADELVNYEPETTDERISFTELLSADDSDNVEDAAPVGELLLEELRDRGSDVALLDSPLPGEPVGAEEPFVIDQPVAIEIDEHAATFTHDEAVSLTEAITTDEPVAVDELVSAIEPAIPNQYAIIDEPAIADELVVADNLPIAIRQTENDDEPIIIAEPLSIVEPAKADNLATAYELVAIEEERAITSEVAHIIEPVIDTPVIPEDIATPGEQEAPAVPATAYEPATGELTLAPDNLIIEYVPAMIEEQATPVELIAPYEPVVIAEHAPANGADIIGEPESTYEAHVSDESISIDQEPAAERNVTPNEWAVFDDSIVDDEPISLAELLAADASDSISDPQIATPPSDHLAEEILLQAASSAQQSDLDSIILETPKQSKSRSRRKPRKGDTAEVESPAVVIEQLEQPGPIADPDSIRDIAEPDNASQTIDAIATAQASQVTSELDNLASSLAEEVMGEEIVAERKAEEAAWREIQPEVQVVPHEVTPASKSEPSPVPADVYIEPSLPAVPIEVAEPASTAPQVDNSTAHHELPETPVISAYAQVSDQGRTSIESATAAKRFSPPPIVTPKAGPGLVTAIVTVIVKWIGVIYTLYLGIGRKNVSSRPANRSANVGNGVKGTPGRVQLATAYLVRELAVRYSSWTARAPASQVTVPDLRLAVPVVGTALGQGAATQKLIGLWLRAAEQAYHMGDKHEARALLDRVLDRDPHNSAAWHLKLELTQPTSAPGKRQAAAGRSQGRLRLILPNVARIAVPLLILLIAAASGLLIINLLAQSKQPGLPQNTQPVSTATQKPAQVWPGFNEFWNTNGGISIFGGPISQAITEVDDNGQSLTVQYFERSRLELHPRGGSNEYTIEIGQLGRSVTVTGTVANPLPEGLRGEQAKFAETTVTTPQKFYDFWQQNGSARIFGYPVTPVLLVTVPGGNNRKLAIQYFENACFEYHPEATNSTDQVQLTALGRMVYSSKYGGK